MKTEVRAIASILWEESCLAFTGDNDARLPRWEEFEGLSRISGLRRFLKPKARAQEVEGVT